MSRPAKLSESQCRTARAMHERSPKRWSAVKLAKRFNVSESSMYNVLNGSYHARPAQSREQIPVVPPVHPMAPQPSIFQKGNPLPDVDLNKLGEVDEITLAAAQLIVARSRFAAVIRRH